MGLMLDLRQIVFVLSDALDLVGVDDVAHGKRVAYMAHRIGTSAGLGPHELDDGIHAGLFHDCGVSSTREHRDLTAGLDWGGEEAHCIRGETLVSSFAPLARLAPVIRWHHTHASTLSRLDAPAPLLRLANLIYLADRVDALVAAAPEPDPLLAAARIRTLIAENRGTRFMPDLVDAFQDESSREAFWLTLEPRALGPWLGSLLRNRPLHPMSPADLKSLASVLATIVDAKSPFTAEHSHRVSAVARHLALELGMDPVRVALIEVAALLHDLGKLRVPDAILDKPAPLAVAERIRITRHAFDTWQILSRIQGFDEVAGWAAHHHEWVSGGGYPFGLSGDALGPEARLIAVADVFQALRQDRPYRHPMDPAQSMFHVDRMVAQGHLDGDIAGLLHRNLPDYAAAADGA